MKKVLLLLIFIYTSCNGPTGSNPDLSEAIIGNWWLYKKCVIDSIGGTWDTATTYYTLDTTNEILVFKHDSIVDGYYRDYPDSGYDIYTNYYYFKSDDTITVVDTGPRIDYYVSIKNGMLSLVFEYGNYRSDEDYKEYIGPIPPEW